MQAVFEATKLDKITKGENVDKEVLRLSSKYTNLSSRIRKSDQ
jgi:hypothetical protein